jgi:hydrogenase maturation protein HypF
MNAMSFSRTPELPVPPTTLSLSKKYSPTLAFGTHLKNTVCALNGNQARISPIHANLEEENSLGAFREAIVDMRNWLGGPPEIVAYDLHPDYVSTKVAAQLATEWPGVSSIGVQHHHAHIVSCMAEHGLEGPVLGVALDGTGYGLDGTIWGGEILVAESDTFRRAGWIQPIPLPGGARAVLEPWRVGLSYLYRAFGPDIYDLGIDAVTHQERKKLDLIIKMIEHGINAPLASSCGRMFDAVAAILGVREHVQYEGEAAMELERLVKGEWNSNQPRYSFALNHQDNVTIIDPATMVFELVRDCREHIDADECSLKFHNGLIDVYATALTAIAEKTNIQTVVLSGGCFLNKYLRNGLRSQLESQGFSVFLPHHLPVGDPGISLGQAVVGASIFARQTGDSPKAEEGELCYPT